MFEFGKFRPITVTSDTAQAVAGSVVIMGILVSANGGNVDCEFCNALTDTGSDEIVLHQLDGTSDLYDFTNFGGHMFATGLTIDTTANAQITVFVN